MTHREFEIQFVRIWEAVLPHPVLSTIEDWRIGSGPDGEDLASQPRTNACLEPFRELAPDCMGRWIVCWRQNMPGLDNRARDEQGKPMRNCWVLLCYLGP